MKKTKDTDYLHISARIRCIEGQLLTNAQRTRLAEAASAEEAAKILTDQGWPDFDWRDMNALEEVIRARRQQVTELLYEHIPVPELIGVFRLKYDYHNIKAVLKGEAQNVDPSHLLLDSALIPPKELQRMMREKEYEAMAPVMAKAVEEASELLARTADPQLSDMVLDLAEQQQALSMAKETGSAFLEGYVSRQIDCNNLRTAVRLTRMEKGLDYMARAIAPGGQVPADVFYAREGMTPDWLERMLAGTVLAPALPSAKAALEGEGFARLDKACDDILIEYARGARFVPFGEQTVIAYLLANEAEFSAVRTILAGKNAGLSSEKIVERLRESYVV